MENQTELKPRLKLAFRKMIYAAIDVLCLEANTSRTENIAGIQANTYLHQNTRLAKYAL